MRTIFTNMVYFCIIFQSSIIQGNHYISIKNRLDGIAKSGGNIDNIFVPSKNGCLGYGSVGLTYKGVLLKIGEEVAMKFIPDAFEADAKTEHKAYIALGAVNNTQAEAFGIPTLYHYGRWENYIMIAVTLLDLEFADRKENNQLTTVDILIVFRELVRITKYIHSFGIFHNDLHLDNIMFRQHQGFLIDYNMAIEIGKNPEAGIFCAKKDWRKFLADIAYRCNVKINWASGINPVKKFENIKPDGLKKVFCEFARTTYGDAIIKYNKVYKTINEEIERYNGQGPALVSWLTAQQWLGASNDLSVNPIPSIESIH